jgi:integration host factor subunit beta
MKTITKKLLIDRIADTKGMRRVDVKDVVQEFLDQLVVELGEGNRLEFRDFGVFEVKQRAPRMAQNPKTLERVPVPAKNTVKFKVGRKMREALEAAPVGPTKESKSASAPAATTTDGARSDQSRNGKVEVHMGPAVAGKIGSDAETSVVSR